MVTTTMSTTTCTVFVNPLASLRVGYWLDAGPLTKQGMALYLVDIPPI